MKISKLLAVIFCTTMLLTAQADLPPDLQEIVDGYMSTLNSMTALKPDGIKEIKNILSGNIEQLERDISDLPQSENLAEFSRSISHLLHSISMIFPTTQQMVDIAPLHTVARLTLAGRKCKAKMKVRLLQKIKEEIPKTVQTYQARSLMNTLDNFIAKKQLALAEVLKQEEGMARTEGHQEEEVSEDKTWKEIERIMAEYVELLEEQHMFHRDEEQIEEIIKNNLEHFHRELLAAYHSHIVDDEVQFRGLLKSLSKATERILPTEGQLIGAGVSKSVIQVLAPASERAVGKVKQHIYDSIRERVLAAGPDSHSHKWYRIAIDELREEAMKIEEAMAGEAEMLQGAIDDDEEEMLEHLFSAILSAKKEFEASSAENMSAEDQSKVDKIFNEKSERAPGTFEELLSDPGIDTEDELRHFVGVFMNIIETLAPTEEEMAKAGVSSKGRKSALSAGRMFESQAKDAFFDALLNEIPREDTRLYGAAQEEAMQHKLAARKKELEEEKAKKEAMDVDEREGATEEEDGEHVFAKQCLTMGTFAMLMAFAAKMF